MSPIEEDKNDQNVAKDQVKQTLKRIGKRIGRKLILILLPIIAILLLISAITWFIFQDEGTWDDDEKANPSTYTKNVELSTTEGIVTDKMELVKTGLKNMGYTDERIAEMDEAEIIEILQISQKLNKTVTSIDDCTEAEILWCVNNIYSKYLKKPEDLDYLLKAEVVTQYPKIDNLPEDKLNGVIRFVRLGDNADTNGDGVVDITDIVDIEAIRNRSDILSIEDIKERQDKIDEEINKVIDASPLIIKYISESEFDILFNDYVATGNIEVFNYFTIDDQGNLIIATWTEEYGTFESNNTAAQGQQKVNQGYTESSIQSGYDSRYAVTENTTEKITASYVTYNATKTPINYKQYVQEYTLPFEYLWSLLVMSESDEFVLGLAQLAYDAQIVVGLYDSTITTITIDTHQYTENFQEREIITENPGTTTYTSWRTENYTYEEKNTITKIEDIVNADVMYADVWCVEIITTYMKVKTQESFDPEITTVPDEDWSDNGSYTIHSSYTVQNVHDDNTKDVEQIFVTTTYDRQKRITNQSYANEVNIEYDKYQKVKKDVNEKTDINPNTELNFVKLLRADENANAMLFKPINVVWLCDILAQNKDTANLIELTQYLINKEKNPDDTSLSFDFENLLNTLGNTFNNLYGGDINVKDSSIFITDIETLKIAFSAYSGSDKLIENAQAFLDMQKQYQVNAIFAAAVSITETSAGRAGNAINGYNNWFNISASGGWATYSSSSEGIKAFGDLIANSKYYYKQGNETVGTIGPVYCPNTDQYPTQADDWVESTLTMMNKFYSKAGISMGFTVTGSVGNLLQAADKVAQYVFANNYTYSGTEGTNYTFPIANYPSRKTISCSSYIQEVLLQAGHQQCAGGEKLWARTNSTLAQRDLENLGFNVQIINDVDQFQPGDIVHYRTGYHVVLVYGVSGNNIQIKGVPEVLSSNYGVSGVTRTKDFLEGKGAYAVRIIYE